MKNAIILHGAGNTLKGNWFPWLKTELENKDYKVFSPDLPNSDNPKIEEWLEAVKDWKLNQDSILIGHSCGGTLILRMLEKLPENLKVKKAILVAAPLDKGSVKEYWPLKEYLAQGEFNWPKIKKSAKQFVLIYSDNDPYDCGQRHGEEINKHVNGKLIIKKDQGHFNLEVGKQYKQFPEMIDYIK